MHITTSYLYMFESENASTLCESVNIYLFPIIFVHLSTGAWGMDFVSSFPLFSTTPLFQNFHINHSFFKIFDSKNCGHRIHVLFMMYDVYWYCQMKEKRRIMKRIGLNIFLTVIFIITWLFVDHEGVFEWLNMEAG